MTKLAPGYNVSVFNRFAALGLKEEGEGSPPEATPSTSRAPALGHVGNAPTRGASQTMEGTVEQQRLMTRLTAIDMALAESRAPEAPDLRKLLEARWAGAVHPDEQTAILDRYEQALVDRGIAFTTLKDLLLNIVNGSTDRLMWGTLMKAVPTAGTALALAQVMQAVYQRSWSGVGSALKALAPLLPALRSNEQLDALIRSLPEALREQLHSLHQWIQDADDAITPRLGIERLLPALGVAAALWYLQRELPSASGSLQGLNRFIAELPHHWSRLVGMDRLGGTLFGEIASVGPGPVGPDGETVSKVPGLGKQARDEIARHLRWHNPANQAKRQHRIRPPEPVNPHLYTTRAELERATAPAPFESSAAPGQPQRGGSIHRPPEPSADAATSSAVSRFGNYMGALFTAVTGVLVGRTATDGFEAVGSREIEMDVYRVSGQPDDLDEVTVTTGLVDNAVPVVASTAGGLLGQGRGILRRHPVAAVGVAGVVGLTALGGALYAALRPGGGKEPTTVELIDRLSTDVVDVDGAWGTGLDMLLGTPELPGARRKRHTPDDESNTPPLVDVQQLGITAQQRDALLGDNSLKGDLRALQTWALAIAQELAAWDGWQWVGTRPASEQELLVHQLHVLRALEPKLAALEGVPQQLLDEAANAHGVAGSTAGIVIDLGPVTAAGVTVRQRMPLLEYCLLRANGRTVDATFERADGTPLTTRQNQKLHAFLGTDACAGLQTQVEQRTESLRPALVTALRARMVVDALKAKAGNALGSSTDYLRGADIVLGFLRGARDVESATLTYHDTLADGTGVAITVPNYLVLRSASADPQLHGQVVLYRSDLANFRTFDNENAFRQFLDTERARSGLHAVNGEVDRTLMEDIVAAAVPAQRAQVRERVQTWEERQANYQAGKGGKHPWNARDAFVLDFHPVTAAGHALDDWAHGLVTQGQLREQQELASNRLRWSALGMAQVDAGTRYDDVLKTQVQSLNEHARPVVTEALLEALRLAGVSVEAASFNPDHVQLRVNGVQMRLTAWATSGWQQHGLSRLSLPLNLGDMPGAPLMPRNPRLPQAPWPSDEDLMQMEVTALRADGSQDTLLTRKLLHEDARRALCGVLDDFRNSNRLGDAYTAHLNGLRDTPDHPIHAAAADQIRTQTRWMIETAHQQGQLGKGSYAALKRAHGALEPDGEAASSLLQVTLNGHPIHGLWALETKGPHYVFVPGTDAGDQLMDEKAFARWTLRPESKDYLFDRTALRYHDSLRGMFDKEQTEDGIPLGFQNTGGPQAAATGYLKFRLDNVDEMTTTQLERLVDTLTIIGSVVAGVSCTLASGGSLAALCITSTLALLGKAIHDGIEFLDRGKVDDAVESIGSGLGDAIDVLNITALLGLMRQLARRGFSTVQDAQDALGQWKRQRQGFTRDGHLGSAFSVSTASLRSTGLPMNRRVQPEGGAIFEQGGRAFVKQDERFVEVRQLPGEEGIRVIDPASPDDPGEPVAFDRQQQHWHRKEQRPTGPTTSTARPLAIPRDTAPPKPDWIGRIPEASHLPAEKIEELEVVFGARVRDSSPPADLRQVVRDFSVEQRVQQIIQEPSTLGLPGDEAVIVRAWADSAMLGNGKGVETYVESIGEWTRGARFGAGPVGLMVEVEDTRTLPGIDALIAASDQDALIARLGLAPTVDTDTLRDAVRGELARVIASKPEQSLQTWRRWNEMRVRLPTAADNLIKHFPTLTKAEAEDIVNRSTVLQKREMESWIFNPPIRATVSDVLTSRAQRKQRQAVVNNDLRTLADVQQLSTHLQGVLPGRQVTVRDDGNGGTLLVLGALAADVEEVRLNFVGRSDVALTVLDNAGMRHETWQQAVFPQLSAAERTALKDPSGLRRNILQRMKNEPGTGLCTVPDAPKKPVNAVDAGSERKKRSLDCDPPPSVFLTPRDIAVRDELAGALQGMHRKLDTTFLSLRRDEREFKRLQKKLQDIKPGKLDAEDTARLALLQKVNFRTLNGYDSMNAAYYRMGDLQYDGKEVVLPTSFPPSGFALSTIPRQWMEPGNFVNPVPVRRVFLPAAQSEGLPVQNGMFRSDYAMGADLIPSVGQLAAPGQASRKITLREEDLLVTSEKWEGKRPVHALSQEESLQLTTKHLSPELARLYGDAGLLPSNLRTLTPGDYHLYQIRSCSESKIMDGWFDALEETLPTLGPSLRSADAGVVTGMTGNVLMMSDMDPCATSCNRRLTELANLFPNMKFTIYYTFDDPRHRLEFFNDVKKERVIGKNRDAWSDAGHAEETMRTLAVAEMKRPDVVQWLEEDLFRNPPALPVPRLWTPPVEEVF